MSQQQHLQNIFKMKPSGFDPYVETHRETEEARRSKNYVKRQTFQLLHRTVEVVRGVQR